MYIIYIISFSSPTLKVDSFYYPCLNDEEMEGKEMM